MLSDVSYFFCYKWIKFVNKVKEKNRTQTCDRFFRRSVFLYYDYLLSVYGGLAALSEATGALVPTILSIKQNNKTES